MRKIIFVNRYFYPDISATSQMLSGIIFELAKTNDEIYVVTNRYLYNDANLELSSKELIKNVHIHRVWTSRFGRGNLLGRLFDYLSFYMSSFLTLLVIVKKGDVIVAKTDPPMISVMCSFVCTIKKAKLVNWLQDLFPEVAKELGIKIPGFLYRCLISLRNQSLYKADENIVIGNLMAEKLKISGVVENKITVITNWADSEFIYPVMHSENSLRKEWGLDNKLVIGYSGNMGRAHDFSEIMKAAGILKENNEIVFLMIGDGAQKANLETVAKEKKLNMLFKPYQPMKRLSESISISDVHLITLKPALEGLIVPSKFYGIVAAGRAIIFIGDPEGEIACEIRDKGCGHILGLNDVGGLANFILSLRDNNGQLIKFGENSRKLFSDSYSLQESVNAWEAVFLKI